MNEDDATPGGEPLQDPARLRCAKIPSPWARQVAPTASTRPRSVPRPHSTPPSDNCPLTTGPRQIIVPLQAAPPCPPSPHFSFPFLLPFVALYTYHFSRLWAPFSRLSPFCRRTPPPPGQSIFRALPDVRRVTAKIRHGEADTNTNIWQRMSSSRWLNCIPLLRSMEIEGILESSAKRKIRVR